MVFSLLGTVRLWHADAKGNGCALSQNGGMSFSSFDRIETPVLDIGYEAAGDPGGGPGHPAARLPLRRPRLRRGRCRPRRPAAAYVPRALPARLRPDALPRSGRRCARDSRPRSARTCSTSWTPSSIERAVARRLRLGRPGRLHRRGAVAGARARPGHRRRLQRPGHRALRRARRRRHGSDATGTSTTSTPSAAGAGWTRTATSSASCSGATWSPDLGWLREALSRSAAAACTTPTSSTSSSTPTATGTDWPTATPGTSRSRT